VLLEKFCYHAGEIAADAVFVLMTGRYGVLAVGYIKGFALAHSLIDKSEQAITDNVFACLQYMD